MTKVERLREVLSTALDPDNLKRKVEEGWRLVAVEWQREVEGEEKEPEKLMVDVPFGLKVSEDCTHLEENPAEMQGLMLMMELIVQDSPLSKIADELNRQGFRTREGSNWEPRAVFNMLPRLVEVGPRIFSREDWVARRQRLSMSPANPPGSGTPATRGSVQ